MLTGALLLALVAADVPPGDAAQDGAAPAKTNVPGTSAPASPPSAAPAPASAPPAAAAAPSLIEKPKAITPGQTTDVTGGAAPSVDPRLQGRAALPDSIADTPLSPPGPPQKPPPENGSK